MPGYTGVAASVGRSLAAAAAAAASVDRCSQQQGITKRTTPVLQRLGYRSEGLVRCPLVQMHQKHHQLDPPHQVCQAMQAQFVRVTLVTILAPRSHVEDMLT
eukprot:GHVU01129774.1.p1 GENE.GHVU01129774.1~~GHVU01129774.1.p1  ORF type:complete len:102 (-),score=10.22 GHVU01129774.1:58-363(-)